MYNLPISLLTDFETKLREAGYFKRQYFYYATLFLSIACIFSGSVYILVTVDTLWIQVINAVVFAMCLVQFGILGHDFSHNQVFTNRRANKSCGIILWGLFAGLSESKWYFNHNEHHKEVNHSEHDPDLQMPFIFGEEQVPFKKSSYVALRKYQHILFFLVLPLVYPIYIIRSLSHIFSHMNAVSVFELFLMCVHYILFFYILSIHLTFVSALLFLFVFSVTTGLYMGLVFAPNHKGMPMVKEEDTVQWWHQIVCTRNIYPNKILFHLMGGLDYQIEHHLFTTMPRCNYPKVSPLVQAFCNEHNLPYYQTSWKESMREIFISLQKMRKIEE